MVLKPFTGPPSEFSREMGISIRFRRKIGQKHVFKCLQVFLRGSKCFGDVSKLEEKVGI